MADQSDLIGELLKALLQAGEPEGWADAPILDGWQVMALNEKVLQIAGKVSGSPKFPDGHTIGTSALRSVDPDLRFVVTQNSVYRLGWPMKEQPAAEAGWCWPPALFTASCPNWYLAVAAAIEFSRPDTLPEDHLAALRAANDDYDWAPRRAACKAIAERLFDAGRKAVAEAWCILEADIRVPDDRTVTAAFVAAGAAEVYRWYGRDLHEVERRAVDGWKLLAKMDDAQIEKLPNKGILSIADPIATANRLAEVTANNEGSIQQKIDLGPDVGKTFNDDDDRPASGIVVLKAIGGIDSSWSGREVKKAFAPIVGKRLPVTPCPDIAAARRVLAAEFPYAMGPIDVMLGDMEGASSARIRPTLLVGPPGNGKSRLARRIGEISGLYVARYDGAGASNSAFGGTARRWSTGEPSVPVLALLAAKKADALVILDEVEKAGTSRHNGRLADSLLPFLEGETARCYPDPYAQAEVDVSRVSYIATCNNELDLPGPLRDRFRLLRIAAPTLADLPALCRGIVADLVKDSGSDPAWLPDLEADELDVVAQLWKGGSVRRLRDIVSRLVVKRADMPRH